MGAAQEPGSSRADGEVAVGTVPPLSLELAALRGPSRLTGVSGLGDTYRACARGRSASSPDRPKTSPRSHTPRGRLCVFKPRSSFQKPN